MSSEIFVSMISVSGSILLATISYYFTKRQQREAAWRELKMNHYKELLLSISDIAVDNNDVDAHQRFAKAMNTLALIAPQSVVDAMLSFHDGVKVSSGNRSEELHDELLAKLLLSIREDIRIRPKDDPTDFHYHLVGAPHRDERVKW